MECIGNGGGGGREGGEEEEAGLRDGKETLAKSTKPVHPWIRLGYSISDRCTAHAVIDKPRAAMLPL